MSTYVAHGGKDAVITSEEKRALLHEALLKLGGIPKKILVISAGYNPPPLQRWRTYPNSL